MKAYLVFPGSGPILVLTTCDSILDKRALARLKDKGITRFIAYSLPVDSVKAKYADHFQHVLGDMRETDDLRVLDDDSERAFARFRLNELGQPIVYEGSPVPSIPT